MATPISLNLFQPRRIWLILNFLTFTVLGGAAYTLWQVTSTEVAALADTQLETLIKSRIDDLHNGRYRNFVEGVGEKFRDLSIRITADSETFQIGPFAKPYRCSSRSLAGGGFTIPVKVELCRPFEFPTMSLALVVLGFVCFSSLSYLVLRKSEKDAITALNDFVARQGLSVNRSGGLLSILRRIREMVQEIDESRVRQTELEKSVALAQLARQVAHDIRSPLAALETVSNRLTSMQFTDIDVLRSSVKRLTEITNDLQSKDTVAISTETKLKSIADLTPLARHNLRTIIDEIASEKCAEFAVHPDLCIEVESASASDVDIIVEIGAFNRALSNIINNAVEAMNSQGEVSIKTSKDQWDTIVTISDNGPGIDRETLLKLEQLRPYTTKTNGQGLGLFHARQTLAQAGGELTISQGPKLGTSVELRIPLTLTH